MTIIIDPNQLTPEQVDVVVSLTDLPTTPAGQHIAKTAPGVFENTPDSGSSGATWGSITGTLPNQTDLQTALDGKVDENTAITGATKTKITYDAKGLVTSGADATTADINDSTNRRYVSDAQLVVIGNTSGTNTGDNAVNSLYSGLASSKQDTLVSGTNIKTINSSSLLGSGNLVITGVTNLSYTAATRVIASDTGTDATLPLVTSGDAGLAPASGGGTSNFLRADGTWAAPPTGGVSDGDKGDIIVSSSGSVWTIDNAVVSVSKMSATGTPSATTFLRGDNTWATPAGGSGLTAPQVFSAVSIRM